MSDIQSIPEVAINKAVKIDFKNANIYIKTFGCSLNHSDSEVMAGLLEEAGYNVISRYNGENEKKDANLEYSMEDISAVIINTCSVKNLAEAKFFKELRRWQNGTNAKILVAGCVPQAEPELLDTRLKDVSVIGTRQLVHVVDILNDTLDGEVVHNIGNDLNERLNLPKLRNSGVVEILPICEGCLSNCTYCKTKLARGNLLSYPKEKILSQFKTALSQGCKEFWIASQDNGCYGFDIYRKEKYFLPQLLNDMLSFNGDFRIRLGMANPDHIDRIKDDLIETFKHPKMYKFLHIPVQSGNDRVLKEMKRYYTVKEFKNIVKLFTEKIPDITISTDMIVGFPTETDSEFDDSLSLLKEIRFDVLNFSRFWLRKGTAAENMKQLPPSVIKERGEKMKIMFNDILADSNKKFIGQEMRILIDEHGRNGYLIGRNDSYKQIAISKYIDDISLGDFVDVKIIGARNYYLIGEISDKDRKDN